MRHELTHLDSKTTIPMFFLAFFCLFGVTPTRAQGIIANHTTTDITAIPEADILRAKETLHIAYGHTSHGSQITTGMAGLVGFMNDKGYPFNLYAWNNGGTGGALDLHDYAMSGDLGQNGSTVWADSTRAYLDTHGDVNVIMWSWCGGVSTNTAAGIHIYLNTMDQLEREYPEVTFVYMTGHLDGTGLTGNLHLRNEQIRNYCRANDKVLYDFADIESYDPDGAYYAHLYADDSCRYDGDANGSKESNWAQDWQDTHTRGEDWYECGSAHSEPLNANQKAYAAWWLFAEIAGSNPTVPPGDSVPPTRPVITGVVAQSSTSIRVAWNASTDNVRVTSYRVYRNGTPAGTTSATWFTDTGLAPGTQYRYNVQAYDAAGNASPTSAQVSGRTLSSGGGTPPSGGGTTQDEDLVAAGDEWRYFKGTQEPPVTWTENDFDDSSWLTGPSGFGYGDGDDATVLNDMQMGYSSVYLRKVFVSDFSAVESLTLLVDYDDAFVAYLNGTEIARANISGHPFFDVLPDGGHEAGTPVEFNVDAYADLLLPGVNVLAVHGINYQIYSSDMSINPTLAATGVLDGDGGDPDDVDPGGGGTPDPGGDPGDPVDSIRIEEGDILALFQGNEATPVQLERSRLRRLDMAERSVGLWL